MTPTSVERVPVRTCVGCGRKAPKSELVRFTAVDGKLTEGRRAPGRGAYTCPRRSCFARAIDRRAFNRALRLTVRIEPGLERVYTGA